MEVYLLVRYFWCLVNMQAVTMNHGWGMPGWHSTPVGAFVDPNTT